MNDQRTLPIEDRDFPEWHGGCPHALVWLVDVDVPAVRAAIADARARLGDLLYPRYARQPHVTLVFAGLAPAEGAAPGDTIYDEEAFRADLGRLMALSPAPFPLRIDGWGTFTTSPHLTVEGHDALLPLHRALTVGRPCGAPSYVPHVTVGLYGVSVPLAEVAARMAGWAGPSLDLEVAELTLARYDAADIAGPLTPVGRLLLGTEPSWVTP
ncbi:MAG: 2'-5' RNA ligase family protein [Arachnia sp.]